MLNDRNEALELLMDGGDDASSATLFGGDIQASQEKHVQPLPVVPKELPHRKGRLALCAIGVIGAGIALIIATDYFTPKRKALPPIAHQTHLPIRPTAAVTTTPTPTKPVVGASNLVEEKLDFSDEIPRLLARPVVPPVLVPDVSHQDIVRPIQKKTVPVATVKQKVTPSHAVDVSEKKAVEKSAVSILAVDATSKAELGQKLMTEYAVGDKLPSGETVLSVSKNGDVVTDMRIIKKGQN